MKIGVALSGCDIGGVSAYRVLDWLREEGIQPDTISASGTASAAALLFASGYDPVEAEAYLSSFLREREEYDLDMAIAGFSWHLSPERLRRVRGLSVCSLSIGSGEAVAFTNDYSYSTKTLRTFPLTDAYDVISGSVGAVEGLGNYLFQGLRLCDYSVLDGCPFFPLHLAGCDVILSWSFLPETARTPYDLAIKRRVEESCAGADLHRALFFPSGEQSPVSLGECEEIATRELESCRNLLFQATAFGK